MSVPREVTVLGSTGSIGRQAIAVAQQNPDRLRITGAGRRRRRRRRCWPTRRSPSASAPSPSPGPPPPRTSSWPSTRRRRSAAGRRASTRCRRSSPARGRPRSWPPAPPTSSSTASPARSGSAPRCRRCRPGAPSRWPTRSRWSPGATWSPPRPRPGSWCRSTPSTRRWPSACAAAPAARSPGWCSPPAAARSAAGAADDLADVTVERGARAPDLGHGPGRHDQLRDPGEQGPGADRGPPALRRPLRRHRRRRAPAVDRALDGHLRRRRDHRPGQPAGHAAADRAGAGLARPAPGRAAGAGLVDGQHLGVRAAGRGRLPGGAAGPAGRARPAASSRRCSTPPTRRPSPPSWRVACRSGASSTSSRVPSTTRRTSAHPPASRTCWPRRSGPGSTPGASSPEAEAERDPSHDPRDRRLRGRPAVLDRLPRVRPLHLGPEVRHAGAAVHGRLRADGVLPAARRDRVRHQGHPARRLHPHRRHDPAGRGGREQARDPHAQLHRRGPRRSRSTTSCPPTATGSSTASPGGSGSS